MICSFEGCERPLKGRGLCHIHLKQWNRNGVCKPIKAYAPGAGSINSAGYRVIHKPGHLNSSGKGKIYEHTFVMAEHLGRALAKGENVHHINGDRSDNRIDNLELWNTSQPAGQRPADKVKYAIEILSLYAPDLLKEEE